jgi:pimeloyl-ACP methyl ester carboxylesterase
MATMADGGGGVRRRDVVVDGLRLRVAEAGAGPALVLLHGLSASHHNWEHTIAALAGRWRVVAPDLPGHGDSAKPDAPYTIDFFAGMIRSLGRALGVEDAVVIGNSLGGQIAIELALTYPRWTRALVLAAPAGGFAAPLRALGPAIGAAAAPGVLRITLPRTLARCFYDPSSPAHAVRRRLLAERLAHPDFPDFARAVARSLAGALAAGRQPLHRLRQPTLLVWGRDDQLVALSGSRRIMREVAHARLAVFERCGHLPMLEHAERFNRLVADFLDAVDGAGRPSAHRASGGR